VNLHVALATAAVLALEACGGGAQLTSAPPASPEPPPAQAQGSSPAAGAASPAPPYPAPSATGATPANAAAREADRELESAQRELDVAAGDCRTACRALASMDRAAGHLCALAEGPDDRARCEEAKVKLRAARDKVRATCGECPGGASTDRNAPVPSAR
jgi:hypothetical protein